MLLKHRDTPAPQTRPADGLGSAEDLEAALASPSAADRRQAAMGLQGRVAAAPALVAAFCGETESSARSALLTALSATPCPAVVQAVLPLLRDDDAILRNGAMEILSAMPEAVAPHIASLLADPDADVRLLTLQLLAELAHPNLRTWLHGVLAHDTHLNVVAAAVEVMVEAGQAEDIPHLQAVLERFDGDAFLTFAVDMAVQRLELA